MPNSHCVLIAEVVDGDRLVTRLGEEETTRAVERCLNRVDLAIGASSGEVVARDRSAVIATFKHCDNGIMAACGAIDRVRKLPPASGTQMRVRIAIHYGEAENGMGEGVEGARLILQACDADQTLASTLVVNELNPAVRKFASTEAFHDDTLEKLPWPVFTIGTPNTAPASPASPASPVSPVSAPSLHPRPRPEPSSPLTSLSPPPVARPPVARTPSGPRMRLKHQQDILFSDENRPVVLLGRELGNDVVIIDPRASRQHARIERRRDGFVLIDESTNGCFVAIEGHEEQCLKGAELPLTGSGRFGCGFSTKEFENDLVFFELV